MYRLILAVLMTFAPAAILLSAGCEKEVRTIDRKTTVQESEPQMVSPGQEVVE